jgi:hypothetical protein
VPGVKRLRVTYRKKLQELPNPIRKKAGGRRGEGEWGVIKRMKKSGKFLT